MVEDTNNAKKGLEMAKPLYVKGDRLVHKTGQKVVVEKLVGKTTDGYYIYRCKFPNGESYDIFEDNLQVIKRGKLEWKLKKN